MLKNAATVTAAVLTACCCNRRLCADALQSSSSFPHSPRGHDVAHRYLDEGHPFTYAYLDEGHPFTYNPTNGMDFPIGGEGAMRAAAAANDQCGYRLGSTPPLEQIDDVPERQPRRAPRRRSRLAPRSLRSSILTTRRKAQTSPDLLTFDEEKEIAGDIRSFRAVTRARDNLADWMSREQSRAGGNQRGEPSDRQLASACSLSVGQLREIMARGQEARTRLIKANVGLVTMIAKRYHNMLRNGGMGNPTGGGAGGTDATLKLDDLVQEGYMGIMEAAERYDPSRGCRFSTYATHWIRQRIVRSIAESSRTIRLPVHVQAMIRSMHRTNRDLESRIGRRPSMPELAHEMGVPPDKLSLYQHLSRNVLSLELPVDGRAGTDDRRTLGDRVACTDMATPDEDFMSESLRGEVHAMLDTLGNVERLILTHRFGLYDGRPKSLRETAEGMGVSSDVVRTMEAKALNKLRQPRMNYRLKEYVEGPDACGGECDCAEAHHRGAADGAADDAEERRRQPQRRQHYYHYPRHMNAPGEGANEVVGDDDSDEYDRPTPESIWSF